MIIRYMTCAALLVMHCGGCVTTLGERTPNLIADLEGQPALPVGTPPAIKLLFTHEHQMEGSRQKGFVEDTTRTSARLALDRIVKENPFLARASLGTYYDVHYVLALDTLINEHGQLAAFVAGSSFLLIPASTRSDVVMTGTLYEAATGNLVGVYEAATEIRTTIWLPLIIATPITLFTGPGEKETYDDTYRDLFAQIAGALDGKELPKAVPAASIVIEEQPAHIQRTIRSIRSE